MLRTGDFIIRIIIDRSFACIFSLVKRDRIVDSISHIHPLKKSVDGARVRTVIIYEERNNNLVLSIR